MSDKHEIRVWLGWRKPAAEGGPVDWDAFRDALGRRFLPATWRVMTKYGLLAYGPSVLSGTDDADAIPWPDETAVLVYQSVAAYEEHRNHQNGRDYGAMHGEVFTKKGGARGSRSDWATSAPISADKPLRRMAKSGGADFSQPDSKLSMLFLAAPDDATAEALMSRLPAADSEAVIWCTNGLTVVWMASRQPLALDDLLKPILAVWPEMQVRSVHNALPVPKLQPQGVVVIDNTSWHMCAGMTGLES